MSIRTDRRLMDGMCLRDALLRARDLVQAHVEEINRLNVFPVPDGDTGTNMYLTLNAIAEGLEEGGTELTTMLEVISHSALLGARGNSGVILSQFLAGFAAVFRESEPRTDAQTGVVAISPGDGFAEIMRSLGANEVLVGRPSVGDLLAVLFREEAPLVAYAVGVAILSMMSGFFDILLRIGPGGWTVAWRVVR